MTSPLAPLTHMHPQRCVRTLDPGMVKRVLLRGPLHAYYAACPACGFSVMHLQSEGRFVEDGEVEAQGARVQGGLALPFRHARLVGSAPMTCMACRKTTQVVDGQWVVVDGVASSS